MDQKEGELFSEEEVVSSYTDEQAIDDQGADTIHRWWQSTGHGITSNLYRDLKEHHKDYNYDDPEYLKFFLNELLPLVPYAVKEWNDGGILKSDYGFKAGEPGKGQAISQNATVPLPGSGRMKTNSPTRASCSFYY